MCCARAKVCNVTMDQASGGYESLGKQDTIEKYHNRLQSNFRK